MEHPLDLFLRFRKINMTNIVKNFTFYIKYYIIQTKFKAYKIITEQLIKK